MALDAVIQRFQLLEVVGRGGMGIVYRAHDPQLLRDVAIKVLSTECVPAPLRSHPTIDLRAAATAVHDELIDEARVMAQLSHPNVLPVYEVGLDGGSVFLVMEHIAGANLREWLAGGPALAAILVAFAQAGEGLGAAHARGIVHRDFKPENVLVGADGRVRVADFGLSRLGAPLAAGSPIRVTGVRGTPEYMAPELWRGEPATAASDVFAFCTALAEAILGQRMADPAHIARALRERGIAPGLRAAVLRGLDDDPRRRPGIEHVVAALRAGPRSRRRWIAAASAGVLAAGALAGGLALRADDEAPPCVDDAAVLAGRWDAAQRAAMTSFLQHDASQATVEGARRVLASFDQYAGEIVALGTATCRAGRRGELTAVQVAMRSSCLERRGLELGNVVARVLGDPWDLATAQERAQSPSSVESCRDMEAPAIRDRAAVAALWARFAQVPKLALAERGPAYAQLERDASAAGEAELALRAAISGSGWLREADQITSADEALQRAYRRAVEIRGEGYAAIALVERANLASRNGDPAGAHSMSKLALEVADRPGVSVRTRARIYTGLGRAEHERGEYLAAVEKLRTALDLLTTNNLKTGANELQVRSFLITSLNNIDGRNREAVALARESVELARGMEGERSINHATMTNVLAMTLRVGGDLDGALQHRKRALEILETLLPPESSRLVLQRTDYADDLLAAGQFEQARREFEAGLAQCEHNEALRAFRPNLRGGLAGALWELGRHAESVQLLEQTLVELTSQLGKDHRRTLYYVRVLADYELELGRLDGCARHIAALEDGYRAHPQPRDARAIRLRGILGAQLAIARGDPRAGEAMSRKALAELDELAAEGEHDVLASLAESLVAQRRWADARAVLDRVLASEPRRQQLRRADRVAVIELLIAKADLGLGHRTAAIERARRVRDVLAGFPGQPRARADVAGFLARLDPR